MPRTSVIVMKYRFTPYVIKAGNYIVWIDAYEKKYKKWLIFYYLIELFVIEILVQSEEIILSGILLKTLILNIYNIYNLYLHI